MPSLNIQFHCGPSEIADIVCHATHGKTVTFVLIGGLPFSAEEVKSEDLAAATVRASQSTSPLSLCILRGPADLSGASRLAFYDKNPEIIIVDIGTLNQFGLKQSALSTKTDDVELMSLAKAIAKEIKAMTHAGVTAVNVDTGEKKLMKAFRYTAEAMNLERSGIKMLPFAGGVKLLLGSYVD